MKISFSLVLIVLFSINYVTIPGHLPGFHLASIEYLKQLFVFFSASILFVHRFGALSKSIYLDKVTIVFFLLVGYFTFSLFWSESFFDSLRYINKVWLTFSLVLLVLTSSEEDLRKLISFFAKIFWVFIFLTIVGEFVLRDYLHPHRYYDPRLAGFSDIHSTKYLLSISSMFFFVRGIFQKKPIDWIGFIIATFLAFLSLQRALIAGMVIGFLIIYLVYLFRYKKIKVLIKTVVVTLLITFIMFILVFEYRPFRERMFYTDRHAEVAKDLLLSGNIVEFYDQVHLTGRERFWSAAQNNERPFIGNGFGTAGHIVEREIGEYWEMHNDYLKLYVETGYLGVLIYFLFIFVFIFTLIKKVVNTKSNESVPIYFMSIGIFIIAPVNGLFDNALDHIAKNICFALVMYISAKNIEISKFKNLHNK